MYRNARRRRSTIAFLSAVAMSIWCAPSGHAQVAELENLAFAPNGQAANGPSYLSNNTSGRQVSANGRWVTFRSGAPNITPSSPFAFTQIFVLDRHLRTTELVSKAAGTQAGGNGASLTPSISADGRYVIYYSEASNLVFDDSNGIADLFVTDRISGVTERVSVAGGNIQLSETCARPAISGDGRVVAFACSAPQLAPGAAGPFVGVFIRDRQAGLTTLLTRTPNGLPIDGLSRDPSLSYDGRYVAIESNSTQLDPTSNGTTAVYRYDRQTGQVETVSTSQGLAAFGYGASISYDGQRVAFTSTEFLAATDLSSFADVYVRDIPSATTFHVSRTHNGEPADGPSLDCVIAGDGKSVAFISVASNLTASGHNGTSEAFWGSIATGGLLRLAQNRAGQQGNDQALFPSMGGDHRTVLFNNRSLNWTPDVGPRPLFDSVYAARPRTDQLSADGMEGFYGGH